MKEIKRGAEREGGREQQAIEREVKRKAYKEREREGKREKHKATFKKVIIISV